MPIISQFYGIIITMFYNEPEIHHNPHLHARYNGLKASYDLDSNKISGDMPLKQDKLIQAWIQIHKEELNSLWILMRDENKYFKIKPLN